jgi:putative 4-mercaptohistidine N1-methyltranferase
MYLSLHFPSSGVRQGVDPILAHDNAPTHALAFPQRVAKLLSSLLLEQERRSQELQQQPPDLNNYRALDIGCAVGGSSFELAKTFDIVDAFDFSDAFVAAAKRMQTCQPFPFKVRQEGDLYQTLHACQEDGMTEEICSKIHFFQGDACDMSAMVNETSGDRLAPDGAYDGILLANLICRLPDPMACLNALPRLVRGKGSVVVIVTPFSWLTEFTTRDHWLGGYFKEDADHQREKEPVDSLTVLRSVMEGNGFEKIHQEEMPLLIREHQRKYQYIISQATGWRKKE